MTEYIDVVCPICRTPNKAKSEGHGFLSVPCVGCKYPIYDMDTYHAIVMQGKPIMLNTTKQERTKYRIVGILVSLVSIVTFVLWLSFVEFAVDLVPLVWHYSFALKSLTGLVLLIVLPILIFKYISWRLDHDKT